MKRIEILFLMILFSSSVIHAQNGGSSNGESGGGGGVKIEIFHVDLVPATFVYGAAELAFEQLMEGTMDGIIKSQTVIDSMFYKMVILEEKTQAYQRNLQAHLLTSLNENYINDMIKIIDDNQKWMDNYLILHPDCRDVVDDSRNYVQKRAHNIKQYINDAAKKTGNEGRLDNVQRNDINLYVIEELKKLCFVSQGLKRMLATVNPLDNSLKIPVRKD